MRGQVNQHRRKDTAGTAPLKVKNESAALAGSKFEGHTGETQLQAVKPDPSAIQTDKRQQFKL